MTSSQTACVEVMREVDSRSSSHASRIFTEKLFRDEICSRAGYENLSSNEFVLLATYLSRDKGNASFDRSHKVLKFSPSVDESVDPVTQEDLDIASMRSLVLTLEEQVDKLEVQIGELDDKARESLARKNTVSAKAHLRSKKLAESTLQQRISTLHQLQSVYGKIEQAADQVEVVRAMEKAGSVLKTLNERTGGIEKINEIVDDMREEMATTDEIRQAINDDASATIDEAEIDEELEALEKAEKLKHNPAPVDEQKDADIEAERVRKRLAHLDAPNAARPQSEERENMHIAQQAEPA